MLKIGHLFLAAILCFAAASSPKERCDMCICHLDKTVLRLNCSDTKPIFGENANGNPYREPYQESYNMYNYKEFEIEFERNKINMLQRLTLVKVTKLSLAENEIPNIEPGTFTRLKTLKSLSLRRNKLETLHSKSFQGLSNLENLDLSQNLLKSFSLETFVGLQSLKTVSLSHNQLTNIDGKIFTSKTLQTLDLSYNYLSQIGTVVFENLENLTTLNLANNNISVVDNFMFISLTSLTSLDLSFNKITKVDPVAFANMKPLQQLFLSNNQLTEIPDNMELPAGLKVLHLNGNQLTDLGTWFRNLKQLQELHVQENELTFVKLNTSMQLKVLNVSSNQISSFIAASCWMLEVLDLSGNRLSAVPEDMDSKTMPALSWLSLDSNPMRQVHFPTTGIEELNVGTFVNLTWVSVSFMDQLEELGAGAFTGVSSACGKCNNGTMEQTAEEGEAGEFEALAQNCNRSLAIRVAHNPRLSKIHENTFKDLSMCELDLSYNSLTSLDERLTDWESLDSINLQGNPWVCTCQLQWMLSRVLPRVYKMSPEMLYELRCDTPADLRGKRLVHFYNWKTPALCSKLEQLRAEVKPTEETSVTLGSSSAMLGVILGLSAFGLLLVIGGIFLQRRLGKRVRIRNRRL